MNGALAAWLAHPVTVVLAGVALLLLFVVTEALLRSLAQLGNVRFQGVLDLHPRLFPVKPGHGLHMSRVLDSLRWVQIGAIGLLWLVLFRLPEPLPWAWPALAVLLPLGSVVVVRTAIGPVNEDTVAFMLRLVRPLALPVVTLLARLGSAPAPLPSDDDEEEVTDREIQAYLEAGQAAGIFEGEDSEIVESLVDFFDTVVREVMTPRTDMVAVPDTATYRELLEAFAHSHKSRIPVYHETVDRVVGLVHVKNVVRHVLDGHEPPLERLLRECLVVPESKALGDLLRDFQRDHQQLAIVVDEYGGTSGLVTLEDILEEIVGEIGDEHDPRPVPESEELEPGVYRLQGRASLEVLEELYGLELEDADMDTVGGLVFSCHGTVPEPGTEVVDADRGLAFVVEEMEERRIVSVVVRRAEAAAAEVTPTPSGGVAS